MGRMKRLIMGLICKLKGHEKAESTVFIVEKPIPLTGGVVIDGSRPNAIEQLKSSYSEYGHVEAIIYCKRCGKILKKQKR
jgi:hypothetical protein